MLPFIIKLTSKLLEKTQVQIHVNIFLKIKAIVEIEALIKFLKNINIFSTSLQKFEPYFWIF